MRTGWGRTSLPTLRGPVGCRSPARVSCRCLKCGAGGQRAGPQAARVRHNQTHSPWPPFSLHHRRDQGFGR